MPEVGSPGFASSSRRVLARLLLVLIAGHARAVSASPRVDARWTGVTPCGDGLEAAIAGWIANANDAEIAVEVDVTAADAGALVAEIGLTTAWGTSRRSVRAGSCAALERTVGLLVAIALDPMEVAATPQVAETIAISPDPPAPIEPPILPPPRIDELEPPVATPVPRPRRLRATMRLDGLVGVGQVPAPSGGIAGALGLAATRWSLVATAAWWPRRTTTANAQGERAEIGLVTAGLTGCYAMERRAIAIAGCGIAEGGAMIGRGRDVAMARRRAIAYAALGLGPELRWQATPRLGLVVAVEGLALVHRPRFSIEGRGDLYVAPFAAVRSRIGIQLRLP